MKRRALYFVAPGQVEVREESLPELGSEELLVRTRLSAVSAGSELLIYRGQFAVDRVEPTDRFSSSLNFPLRYGYACVGEVIDVGTSMERSWMGRSVFAFQPHASHLVCGPEELRLIPSDVSTDDAVFFPNMETAVNLIQDAAPILGERALVLGQGIVGLLAAALLKEFPLAALVTADPLEARRAASLQLGVTAALDPGLDDFRDRAARVLGDASRGFDLVLEASGNPAALNQAIAVTAFSGRIVVASWYGLKSTHLDLGSGFHRSRIRILSSQVSTISPELSGRWDKQRRFEVVWDAIRRLRPANWISRRFSLDQARDAYSLLDGSPEQALQVVFEYP